MIKSMTGYGKSQREMDGRMFQVEVRSINSKTLDLNLKLPSEFRELEPLFRARIAAVMQRGKVECVLSVQQLADAAQAAAYHINTAQVERYWEDFHALTTNLLMKKWSGNLPEPAIVFTLPGVVVEDKEEVPTEAFKDSILDTLDQALALADASRQQEGEVLADAGGADRRFARAG